MSFGWAYVGCEDIAVTSLLGPSGSILVRTDTFVLSGSQNYKLLQEEPGEDGETHSHALLLTGSFKQLGNVHRLGSTHITGALGVSGDVTVQGNIHANSYNVVNTSITEIEAAGSSNLGDSFGDLHTITGSLVVAGLGTQRPSLVVTGSTLGDNVPSTALQTAFVGVATNRPPTMLAVSGSYSVNYDKLPTNCLAATLTLTSSIVGVNANLAVAVTLPPATSTPGRMVIIKDEAGTQPRTTSNKISVLPGTSNGVADTIDDQSAYYIMGSRAALSLYSDGISKWFVF